MALSLPYCSCSKPELPSLRCCAAHFWVNFDRHYNFNYEFGNLVQIVFAMLVIWVEKMILIGLLFVDLIRETYINPYLRFSSVSGDTSSNWSSNGAQDEPASLQSTEYAARSPTPQQIITSKHSQVRIFFLTNSQTSRLNVKLIKIDYRKHFEGRANTLRFRGSTFCGGFILQTFICHRFVNSKSKTFELTL